MAANLQELLTVMVQRGASDLHLSCGTYPQIRLHGNLEPLEEFEALMPPDTQRLVYSVLTEDQQRRVEQDNELDLSFGVEGLARFRGADQRLNRRSALRKAIFSATSRGSCASQER